MGGSSNVSNQLIPTRQQSEMHHNGPRGDQTLQPIVAVPPLTLPGRRYPGQAAAVYHVGVPPVYNRTLQSGVPFAVMFTKLLEFGCS